MVNIALILLPLVLLLLGVITHFLFADPLSDNDTPVLTTKNTIITFDLHGVIFTPDYFQILKLLFTNKQTLTLLRHIIKPSIMRSLYTLWQKKNVAEGYLISLTSTHTRLKNCLPLLIALGNAQKPNKGTVDLIASLKKKGFELHVFSNIGDRLQEDLNEKFKDIFSYFDAIKVASGKEEYKGKPHKTVFLNYLQNYNPHQKNIVFIDNKSKNIKAAQDFGIIGIHFRSAWSVQEQLDLLL